jgi:hypothetical protein
VTRLAVPGPPETSDAASKARFALPVAVRGLLAAVLTVVPVGALAQSSLPGRLEVSGGVRWTGPASVGENDASETSPTGSRYRLFATDSSLAPATGFEGHLAVGLTQTIEAALSAEIAKSSLRTAVSADVEGIPDVQVTESITQVALEGTAFVHLPSMRFAEATVPFVSAGLGFLRHLHEGRTLAETGTIYHLGGGFSYMLKRAGTGLVKSTGLRASARAVLRHGGAALDDAVSVSPAVGVAFFARF